MSYYDYESEEEIVDEEGSVNIEKLRRTLKGATSR